MAGAYEILILSSVASSLLAAVIAIQASRAYWFTKRRYLLNFVSGFFLMSISYYLLAFGLEPIGRLEIAAGFEWPRLVVQATAFALIASSYYSKDRSGERFFLAGFAALGSLAFLFVLLAHPPNGGADEFVFLINTILSVYVFGKSAQGYQKGGTKESRLAVIGFGLLAVGQYTWLIWGLDGGDASFLFASSSRAIGLAIIASSFLLFKRREDRKSVV